MKIDPESVLFVGQVVLFAAVGWFIVCWLNAMLWIGLGGGYAGRGEDLVRDGFFEPVRQLEELFTDNEDE